MSSRAHASELLIAELACRGLARLPNACVLIGGLGLGFSLKQVLSMVAPSATVQVAELLPEVVTWNRELLRALNGALLEDPRVKVLIGDVFKIIRRASPNTYDAIILDVDNGPIAMVADSNAKLYEGQGLARIKRSLRLQPAGCAAFWSASEDLPFVRRLTQAGFRVQTAEAKSHPSAKNAPHRIYVAENSAPPI